MSKHVSPKFYMVVWDGVPFKRGFLSRAEASAFAERWQGERYRKGMLKHGDKKDYFEVKRDLLEEAEFNERYDVMLRNNPQKIRYQYRTGAPGEGGTFA